MEKKLKQTVYLPVKVEDNTTYLITKELSDYLNSNCSIDFYKDGKCVYTPCFITQTTKESEELEHLIIERLDKKEGYFFTPEQLNEYTQNVIKQALETAAEKVELVPHDVDIDLESITNTFEETYNKLKVTC